MTSSGKKMILKVNTDNSDGVAAPLSSQNQSKTGPALGPVKHYGASVFEIIWCAISWVFSLFVTANVARPLNMDASIVAPTDLEELGNDIPRAAGKLAALCRLELPLTHSKANVLVAKEWLVRYMDKIHVRKSDQVVLLPIALKLCFVETKYERQARELTLTPEYQRLYRETHTRMIPGTWMGWLFNHKEPVPTDL